MAITTELEKEVDEIIMKLPNFQNISSNIFNNAKNLMAYYNINRILMAGFKLNLISLNNETNLDNFISSSNKCNLLIPHSSDLKMIMEFDGAIISSNKISKAKRFNSKYVGELFHELANFKLGKIIKIKNKTGPCCLHFEKLEFKLFENNIDLVNLCENLNIDFTILQRSYNINDNNVSSNYFLKLLYSL